MNDELKSETAWYVEGKTTSGEWVRFADFGDVTEEAARKTFLTSALAREGGAPSELRLVRATTTFFVQGLREQGSSPLPECLLPVYRELVPYVGDLRAHKLLCSVYAAVRS